MNTIIGGNYYTGILDDFIIKKDDLNVFNKLDSFIKKYKNHTKLFFISYDLKNKIENLKSEKKDPINFPILHCIVPEKKRLKNDFINLKKSENVSIKFKPELTKKEYLSRIKK